LLAVAIAAVVALVVFDIAWFTSARRRRSRTTRRTIEERARAQRVAVPSGVANVDIFAVDVGDYELRVGYVCAASGVRVRWRIIWNDTITLRGAFVTEGGDPRIVRLPIHTQLPDASEKLSFGWALGNKPFADSLSLAPI
jgi:hypothetical protein